MTLGKLFIAKRTFIIYKKTTKIYSLGNECPLARVHCLARDTISSKESWIVRCSRLRHAIIIELRGSSKLCGCCWCGTFQICCLRYPHRKTSHIARSGERGGHGQFQRLLISRGGNCPRRYCIVA